MLSPADLVDLAENFALRIPREAAFEDERQVSWELIGNAHLQLGNAGDAERALKQMSPGSYEAEFRCAFARWTLQHPESDVGRRVLGDTLAQADRLKDWLGPGDLEELAVIGRSILGEPAEARFAEFIEDIPESLASHAANLMGKAQEALAAAKVVLGPPAVEPLDSRADRLSRFLNYRYNDLKIRWLVEQAAEGGLVDADLESQIESDVFQRLEPARQPSIYYDPLHLEPNAFGAFLFARPIALRKSDENLLQGDYMRYGRRDERSLVMSATGLFLAFQAMSQSYSQEQMEQGLWFLFGHACGLFGELAKSQVPQAERLACVEAMLVPFRDYYQHEPTYEGSIFFMWWDYARDLDMEIAVRCREVLEQILQLPHRGCQFAAIHGLNHLRPDAEASAMVARYLESHRAELEPKDIAWIEQCRDGKAL